MRKVFAISFLFGGSSQRGLQIFSTGQKPSQFLSLSLILGAILANNLCEVQIYIFSRGSILESASSDFAVYTHVRSSPFSTFRTLSLIPFMTLPDDKVGNVIYFAHYLSL